MPEHGIKKILVIDDEQDIIKYLAIILRDNGYEVATAVDGVEAFDRLREERPDLITLDLAMPEKTGVKFYQELKAAPEWTDIPVLVISAFQPEFEEILNRRLTVPPPEGYLFKPFRVDELLAAVRSAFARFNAPA